MTKRIKKGKLLFLIILFLFIFGYAYQTELIGVSTRLQNTELWSKLTGLTTKENPNPVASDKDVKLYEEAIASNDESFCLTIEFADFQQDCLVRVAVAKQDIQICEMVNQRKTQYSCFVELSKETNDVEICKRVEDDAYWNTICYKNYAVANNDSEYCWFIPEGIHNNPCVYDVAINSNDWVLCNEITDTELQTKCNYILARKLLTIEPCLQMWEELDRDACILRQARYQNDVTICEGIKFYKGIKKDCLNIFKGRNNG